LDNSCCRIVDTLRTVFIDIAIGGVVICGNVDDDDYDSDVDGDIR
jgi:hypothetical protein